MPEGIDKINLFGVPLLNSFLLLSRAVSLTWCHYFFLEGKKSNFFLLLTIFLGLVFLVVQFFEYKNISFSFRDSAYGSIFYILTGFHGFHVFLGVFFLFKNCIRLQFFHFSRFRSLGLDFRILYWHFVDFV